MKPDWSQAPEWASWLSQGENGYWWWHEARPNFFRGHWVSRLRRKIATKSELIAEYYITLEQRPK